MIISSKDQEIMENFDALLWGLVPDLSKKIPHILVQKNAFKYSNGKKVEKIEDLGYKYYVCMFKNDHPNDSVEVWSGILGDPHKWVDNMADMGYNGVLIKKESVPKKTAKEVVKKLLTNYGVDTKAIKLALKQII